MSWVINFLNKKLEPFYRKRYFSPSIDPNDAIASIAIKIPANTWKGIYSWGDYHMAVSLKKQLEALGYHVLLQVYSEWDNDEGRRCDAVIVFRGLKKYKPTPNQINLLWNISHPDDVSLEEYDQYDKVFIASEYWARKISNQIDTPVDLMFQCTDPDIFKPFKNEERKKYHHQLLFVGNSRGVYRKILRDLLPTPFDLAVYGKQWKKIIPSKYIKSKYIKNNQLYKYYASADILLNDHWQDMREKGFASNRLYDGLSSGAFIITDKVKGMGDLERYVQTYETKEELENLLERFLNDSDLRLNSMENRKQFIGKHTFNERAKQFSVSIQNFLYIMKSTKEKKNECNICLSQEFKAGPLGRLTKEGDKPHCVDCGSLERHRLIRKVWNLIPTEYLQEKKSLQFSLDPSVDGKWFLSHEVSIYGHKNSIDLQEIERDDEGYDIVICNQILEHVEKDKKAFSELIRIISHDGFLQITVPNPIKREMTEDWGYPKENFHGHYRHYGIDLIEKFREVLPDIHMINIRAYDQVTATEDFVFFWTQSKATRDYLLDAFIGKIEIEQFF